MSLERIEESGKVRIKRDRLLSYGKIGMLKVLIEVRGRSIFEQKMKDRLPMISVSNLGLQLLPESIYKARVTLDQLADIVSWKSVLSVEEDSQLKAEDEE